MLLEQLIIDNIKEIEQADRLGLETPSPEFVAKKMIINIRDITLAYINKSDNIEKLIQGQFYEIKYSESIWDTIENMINDKDA